MFPKSKSSSTISTFGIIALATTGTVNYFPPLINILTSPFTSLSSFEKNCTYRSFVSSEFILPFKGEITTQSGNLDICTLYTAVLRDKFLIVSYLVSYLHTTISLKSTIYYFIVHLGSVTTPVHFID